MGFFQNMELSIEQNRTKLELVLLWFPFHTPAILIRILLCLIVVLGIFISSGIGLLGMNNCVPYQLYLYFIRLYFRMLGGLGGKMRTQKKPDWNFLRNCTRLRIFTV